MATYCRHEKAFADDKEYFVNTWSVPNISSAKDLYVQTKDYKTRYGVSYYASFKFSENQLTFNIVSNCENLKCLVSMFIGFETSPLSKSLGGPTRTQTKYSPVKPTTDYFYDLITLSSKDECFQKLKQRSNDILFFIYRIRSSIPILSVKPLSPQDNPYDLKPLAAILKEFPESLLLEKVVLLVGEETEIVNKAVLCARSPTFAKIIKNDMKKNTITITDIKMPVLKALVSFLFIGKLRDEEYEFDFLCDLYDASDKYDIADLRQLCVDSILFEISEQNAIFILKLGLNHNDMLLKSTAIAFIASNMESWIFTEDWKFLVHEEPKTAFEILNFFNF